MAINWLVKITQITANPVITVDNGNSYVYIIEYEDEGKEANGPKIRLCRS